MQIISRRVHEGLVIGEETQIEVLEIDKEQNCVRLRIRKLSDKKRFDDVTLYLGEGDAECESRCLDNLDDSRELTAVLS